jgi:hypothetical protein
MKAILEKFVLVVLSLIIRLTFLAYRVLIIGVVVLLFTGWIFYGTRNYFPCGDGAKFWWWPIAALTLLLTWRTHRPAPPRDNPYRIYTGLFDWMDRSIDAFIAWIGTLKYFTTPLSLIEDTSSYKIRGDEIRKLIDDILQPGDILLRGFDDYLDGVMIGLSGDGAGFGKYFSHAALYIGDLHDNPDKPIVARHLQVVNDQGQWVDATDVQQDAVRNNTAYFQPGRQKVIHAMTKGVFTEDILTFVRCDYLVILRLPDNIKLSEDDLKSDRSLITELAADAQAIRQQLLSGNSVGKEHILEAVRLSALGKIGSCYDFQFNDSKTHHRFSCSEFVYYCYKSIHCYLGLNLKTHGFLKIFFARKSITPSDIYDAAAMKGKLKMVWLSQSLQIS